VKLMDMPRGLRINNPGNIRHGDKWEGLAEEQPDSAFCAFTTPSAGIRAIARILRSYERRGITSVRDVIRTWAPPVENDVDSYVESVCVSCQIQPTVNIRPYLPMVICAIIKHEQGILPYTPEYVKMCMELE
jgi:hypothetical protein